MMLVAFSGAIVAAVRTDSASGLTAERAAAAPSLGERARAAPESAGLL